MNQAPKGFKDTPGSFLSLERFVEHPMTSFIFYLASCIFCLLILDSNPFSKSISERDSRYWVSEFSRVIIFPLFLVLFGGLILVIMRKKIQFKYRELKKINPTPPWDQEVSALIQGVTESKNLLYHPFSAFLALLVLFFCYGLYLVMLFDILLTTAYFFYYLKQFHLIP